jgi:DNA (cytosine-5)-methyltransferase 1
VRFVELFAGAGGLSLGLERAGMTCVGHAEIEPHARAVLRHHWPDVPLWGDVAQLRGADFPACGLLSGGSPCQDLSVAGKRAGLVDGARSSLFFHQARLWTECDAPYLLWENVHGALSSNAGRDFALVLSTLVGAPIAVPRDGWAGGGVAAGPDAVAAWRVCDLRYFGGGGFGPPQRRVRVFVLAARAGASDPAEILALGEGVCGHPDPREAAGEDAAAEVGASVAGSLAINNDRRGSVADVAFALRAGHRQQQSILGGDVTHALTGEGCDASEDGTGRGTPMVVQLREPVAFVERNGKVRAATTSPALMAQTGATGNQLPSVTQPIADTLTDGANQTWGHPGETVAQPWPDVAPTLTERDHKGAGNFHNGELQATVVQERPRRLMPIETERLMGWPDSWTAEGVDEQGRRYALKDTPRYRLCGNGVGAPVAEWVGRRLMDAVAARRERAA